MLGHGGRGHGEQNAVGVDQADLLALADKGHRLALDHGDANLVGKQAHHRGALAPRESASSCLRRSLRGTKKMLRPMSSPKTGSISARLTSVRPVASILPAPAMRKRESRPRIGLEREDAGDERAEDKQSAEAEKHAAHAWWTDATRDRQAPEVRRAPKRRSSSSGILHLQRHAGQGARIAGAPDGTRRKRDSAGGSSSQIRGRVVFFLGFTPEQGRESRQPSL